MNTTRLFATPDGESRFEVKQTSFGPVELAQGNMLIEMSTPTAAAQLTFFHLPNGWIQGWHQAPRRQYVIVHHGAMHIETSDGEKCRIGPGDTLLVEDISGKGHRTTVPVGDCWGVVVTIPD